MNTKLSNRRSAVIGLALLMFNVGPVLASSITLNGATGNTCDYSAFTVDSNGDLTATCVTTSPTPTPTPQCTLSASPSTISAGATSILTASCSPVATSYVWTGAGTENFTSGGSVTPTVSTTYTVIGTNGNGSGNTASRTVSIAVVTPPPPTGSGPAPTSSSPIAMIKRWIYAFETENFIPHNYKNEPVSYMAYLKLIQSAKPTVIRLPTSW
jgi:hypothetical protein